MKRKQSIKNRTSKIILALDVDNFDKAKYFVNKLYPEIKIFKVGIHLFISCGVKIIKYIHKIGGEVFLDLKFFDIPNTTVNAVRQAVRMGVEMLTLHILGDAEMLKSALEAAQDEADKLKIKRPLLIGVTVLTSKDAASSDVLILAKMGLDCGLDGVVCSAQEAALLRRKIKKDFVIVTPGIRPKTAVVGDQKRVMTVEEAIKAGSNFLVIGRPILEAQNHLEAAKKINLAAKDCCKMPNFASF